MTQGVKCFKVDERVRAHCNFYGKYRGCAHEKCNVDYSFQYFKIPVHFHNLENYDGHPEREKLNTFSFGYLQFKDSFSLLSASDKLVK